MSKKFIRRSLLYTPGSSMKMLTKAKTATADAIIMDLEDAVSVGEKDTARENVAALIDEMKATGKEVIVRVNAMDTGWGIRDIMAIVPGRPDAVIVPKADKKALTVADYLLSAMEYECAIPLNTIKMIPLFETTYAITNAYEVLGAAERIDGVQLGAEDLTKEQEIERTMMGAEISYARHQLAFSARARGLDIIDTPYTGIKDLEGLRTDAINAKNIGFTGKTCIHPSHADVLNAVFSPSAEAVEYAKGVVEALDQAIAEGKGAVMYMGKMIDAPIADRSRRIIEKAERISKLKSELK
ncbi:MAG: CoA ester lyase [Oscillospiraceae bacterium]